ncbi:MAG: flagellar biosynthetic protein FliQ [Candidatus Eremiobacteraeota bacterium]|nr:flagellar biosynthetic protein FliQ [Candidatus Eremiobacteraeota bacterium]
MTAFDALLHQAFLVCALLALPALAVTTVAGTLIAIVQAATQVQDQTLSLLPKLLATAALVWLFGAFGLRLCAELFASALAAIPALVRG